MSTSGGTSGGGDLLTVTAELDAADISALFSAPTEIVAAPGADRALVVVHVAMEYVKAVDGRGTLSAALYYGASVRANQAHSAQLVGAGQVSNVGAAGPRLTSSATGDIAATLQDAYAFPRTIAEDEALVVGQVDANPTLAGPIVTATLADGGLGYVIGDTGEIDIDIYTGGATYVVDTVAAITGAVLTFHITGAGDGYSTIDNPLDTSTGGAQPGIGTDFTVNVTAIPPGDDVLYVTALYKILDLH